MSKPIVSAPPTSLHPMPRAPKDKRTQFVRAPIARVASANPLPTMIAMVIVSLPQILRHSRNIHTVLSPGDLAGAHQQVGLLELRAAARLPAVAADVVELSGAGAGHEIAADVMLDRGVAVRAALPALLSCQLVRLAKYVVGCAVSLAVLALAQDACLLAAARA